MDGWNESKTVRYLERGRERERDRGGQTNRQAGRQAGRQTDRLTETDRQVGGQADRLKDLSIERHAGRNTDGETQKVDRHTVKQEDKIDRIDG